MMRRCCAVTCVMILSAGCAPEPKPRTIAAPGLIEEVTIHVPEMAARLEPT